MKFSSKFIQANVIVNVVFFIWPRRLSFPGDEPPIWGVELEMSAAVAYVNVTNRWQSIRKLWKVIELFSFKFYINDT